MNAQHEPGSPDRDELVESAWTLVAEGLTSGRFTLPSGRVVEMTPEQIVKHAQWVASLGKRRPVTTPVPKDFFLAQTRAHRAEDEAMKTPDPDARFGDGRPQQ